MKTKIGVIYGGETVEHEVSIISAVQAMEHFDLDKYDIYPIYISKSGVFYTGEELKKMDIYQDLELLDKKCKKILIVKENNKFYLESRGFIKKKITDIDLVFPVVHGTNVEDGVLQGYLKTIGIPFVGSDTISAAIGQDKVVQKFVYKDKNLPLVSYVWFYDVDYLENEDQIMRDILNIGYPVVVKPASLGSSVGISVANNEDEIKVAIENAINYDKKIVVEHAVPNLIEVNISILGNYENQETSVIEEVVTDNDVLTFEDKYINGNKKGESKGMLSLGRRIPANISKEMEEKVKAIAVKAFKALGNSGVVRIDFLINSKTDEVYINEINTSPGSLSFYLWEPIGKQYYELLDDMIKISIKDKQKIDSKIHSFDSNILKGYSGSKSGKLKK